MHLLATLRVAARALLRRPTASLVIVITLALGLGANVAVFSLIHQVMLQPLPVQDPDRVVTLYTSDFSSGPFGATSFPDFADLRERVDAFEDLAAYFDGAAVHLADPHGGSAERLSGALVTENYFQLLGAEMAAGRAFLHDETDGRVAVLSHELWTRRFGAAHSVLGEAVSLNGTPFTVVGVTAPGFRGTELAASPDVWLPLGRLADAPPFRGAADWLLDQRGARWLAVVGRLSSDTTRDQAQTQARAVMAQIATEHPDTNLGIQGAPDEARPVTLLPLAESALGGGEAEGVEQRARFLLLLVVLVLLIACANVANLRLARGQGRRRDVAVRAALGAGRYGLITESLVESLMLSLAGGLAGIGVAMGIHGLLPAFLPDGLPAALAGNSAPLLGVGGLALDGGVLAFCAALALATGILVGVVPALQASRSDLVSDLKDGGRGFSGSSRQGLKDVLVVAQVAASLLLLVAAGLFVRSLQVAYGEDLGFDPEGVLLTALDPGRQGLDPRQSAAFFDSLLERVRTQPGVASASLASFYPVSGAGMRRSMEIEGTEIGSGEVGDGESDPEINMNVVSDDYFRTLGIPLLAGRSFGPEDRSGSPSVIVVNRTFAERFWPGESAIGRRVRNAEHWSEIVGVVGDGKYRSLREDPLPYVYVPLAQQPLQTAMLAVRTERSSRNGSPQDLLAGVRHAVRELDATLPLYRTRTLEEHLGDALRQERTTAVLVGALGLLALALAAIGIYGVMSVRVAERRRELGIRTALGATAHDILRAVIGRGLGLTVAGLVLGVLLALPLARSIAGYLYGVAPSDPVTYVGVAILLALATLAAVWPTARHASRVDPVRVLREE